MYLTISSHEIDLSAGGEIVLRHQSWADYENLLESRQDKAGVKIYYDSITQEIRLRARLAEHSKKSSTLSNLVKSLLRHQEKDWEGFDPITLKRFKQQGVEPNSCFYIQNRKAILGKKNIDLEVDPPPELALETDLTSLTNPEAYECIRIPELWIYRKQALYIYLFDGQHYQESSSSSIFPEIPVKKLIPQYVEMSWTEGSSVALKAFDKELCKN